MTTVEFKVIKLRPATRGKYTRSLKLGSRQKGAKRMKRQSNVMGGTPYMRSSGL